MLWPLLGAMALASAQQIGDIGFGSEAVALRWNAQNGRLSNVSIEDRVNGRHIALASPFSVTLAGGRTLALSDLNPEGPPLAGLIAGDPSASRLAARSPRRTLTIRYLAAADHIRLTWRLIQGDSRYLREEVTLTAIDADVGVTRVDLFKGQGTDRSEVVGRTAGSPVVVGPDYLMVENPLAKSSAGMDGEDFALWVDRALPLRQGQSVTYAAVVGVTDPGQLRRGFARYLEAERAHPYRPFLHYNSWYDIGFFNRYTEAEALDRIQAFGDELVRRRGVKLDSFLFDDGWDDRSGRWGFSADLPHGFAPLREAAARYGAAPGAWLSPWGGYDTPKLERVANGRRLGYEIIDGGFALSGPTYYQRFHDVTLALVRQDGVNQFKFDGTGNADRVVPGSRFDSDFAAAIQLIADLRVAKPDLFINVTTGTYPSPAWLLYADSIWRGGEDHGFAGVGSARQRWITYRDRETYANIVQRGPLFPLNSLMLHGLIYAQHTKLLHDDPGGDFADEVHSFFGSGTDLQELYITPSLLDASLWDTLAEAARWSRANADVLRDTHWIGGDPGRLEVYGWAAWAPGKAIVTLRNPSDRPQTFLLNLSRTLELPAQASKSWKGRPVWRAGSQNVTWFTNGVNEIKLEPFGVVTFSLKS